MLPRRTPCSTLPGAANSRHFLADRKRPLSRLSRKKRPKNCVTSGQRGPEPINLPHPRLLLSGSCSVGVAWERHVGERSLFVAKSSGENGDALHSSVERRRTYAT